MTQTHGNTKITKTKIEAQSGWSGNFLTDAKGQPLPCRCGTRDSGDRGSCSMCSTFAEYIAKLDAERKGGR